MVNVLKTKDGYIAAYLEWHRVDEYGKIDKNGSVIYVRYAWVHKNYEKTNAIRKLIYLAGQDDYSKGTYYIYWFRRKYEQRKSPPFRRYRIERMGIKNDGYI